MRPAKEMIDKNHPLRTKMMILNYAKNGNALMIFALEEMGISRT